MSDPINAAGQAADHCVAGTYQVDRQALRHAPAVARIPPRANQGHGSTIARQKRATQIKQVWRVGDVHERRRKIRAAVEEQPNALLVHQFQFRRQVNPTHRQRKGLS